MNPPPGISAWRALGLLLGLAIRRWWNWVTSGRAAKAASQDPLGPAPGSRPPTRRKRVTTGALLGFVMVFSVLQVGFFTWRFVGNIQAEEHQAVTTTTLRALRELRHSPGGGTDPEVHRLLAQDPLVQELPEAYRPTVVRELTERWRAGESGDLRRLPPVSDVDGHEAQPARIARWCALVFALIAVFLVASGLGLANQDLGQVEWAQLWLTSLPLSAPVLFTARIVEYAVLNPFLWMTVPTFLAVLAGWTGAGLAAPVLGLVLAVPIAAAFAGLRLAGETWVRMHLPFVRRKQIQAVATVLALLFMVGLYALLLAEVPPTWSRWLAGAAPWAWLPTGWPVRAVLASDEDRWLWLGLTVAAGLGLAVLAVVYAAWEVCRGFQADPGSIQGPRRVAPAAGDGALRPLSLLRKDLLLLGRDRALLVQVLVVPLFIVGMQLAVNPGMAGAVAGSFRHACTLAFVLGGYLLIHSATTILSAEGSALWLLTSAPHRLSRLLLQKVVLWSSLAGAYGVLAVGAAVWLTPWPGISGIADALMVCLGIPVFAVICAGVGAAASDPLATEPQRRLNQESIVALMLVMGMYSQAIYTAHGHTRLLWLMLMGVLAYALWQRLDERLPWLLDPQSRPPRRLGLADGALAAMAFLLLQGVLAIGFGLADVDQATGLLLAFSGAGAVVMAGSVWQLRRDGLQEVLARTGLRPGPGWSWGSTLGWAVAGALAATACGVAYLAVLAQVPAWMPESSGAVAELPFPVLIGLAVVAAPVSEEFLFRGLLFTGLATTLPLRWAIPASAAIFALIHPTVSIVPVFILGCVTAGVYHRTRWLLAPMLIHAGYNLAILLVQRG